MKQTSVKRRPIVNENNVAAILAFVALNPYASSRQMIQVMNKIFGEKWIGRGGPVAWLPRLPDLTSPDYFLWGFFKNCVMVVAPTTPDDIKKRMR